MAERSASRLQLQSELDHWRYAISALRELDAFASNSAWAELEEYLSTGLRARLRSVTDSLDLEAAQLVGAFRSEVATDELRERLLRLRDRYVQVETVLDFFGDALAVRSDPVTAAQLRGLDVLAADSMDYVLRPLGIEAPPVLCYFDKGLGASILKAGVRLWDRGNPLSAAAIKITRHNARHPTALLHETGHQVAHLTGWNQELADALSRKLRSQSVELGDAWAGWASEVGADVYAFALSGYAPLPALANVVDGTSGAAFRMIFGDPHPFPWIRVMFNVALCRSWFGPGPWDMVGQAWWERHPMEAAPTAVARLAQESIAAMPGIVDVCTRQPMAAFGGRPLTSLIDPRRVSPSELNVLGERAGPTLLSSSYLMRRESVRILAWLTTRAPDPANGTRLRDWLSNLGNPNLIRRSA